MSNINCENRRDYKGVVARELHQYLLRFADVNWFVYEMDDLIDEISEGIKTDKNVQFQTPNYTTLLPMLEFAGLIEVHRRDEDSHKVAGFLVDDKIVAVKTDPVSVDTDDEIEARQELELVDYDLTDEQADDLLRLIFGAPVRLPEVTWGQVESAHSIASTLTGDVGEVIEWTSATGEGVRVVFQGDSVAPTFLFTQA